MVTKKALLVGCNYANNATVRRENKLYGCINDVKAMHALIRQPRFGFQDENITILTDDVEEACTFLAITTALKGLIDKAEEGDTLLFYFSGGGALLNFPIIPRPINLPVIIPCDLYPITAAYLLRIINRVPDGAFFTFICDSSYSGGLFNKEVRQIEPIVFPDVGPNFHPKTIPSDILQLSDVATTFPADISLYNKILFSSSRANEESVEVYPNGDKSGAFSAFSNAIQTFSISPEAVNPSVAGSHLNAQYSIWEVAAFTRLLLHVLGFYQHPYLNPSDAAALFLGNVA